MSHEPWMSGRRKNNKEYSRNNNSEDNAVMTNRNDSSEHCCMLITCFLSWGGLWYIRYTHVLYLVECLVWPKSCVFQRQHTRILHSSPSLMSCGTVHIWNNIACITFGACTQNLPTYTHLLHPMKARVTSYG